MPSLQLNLTHKSQTDISINQKINWRALEERLGDRPTFWLIDDEVYKLYRERLELLWRHCHVKGIDRIISLESNKTLTQVQSICQKLADCGAGRDTCLVALGGGLVSDIGTMVAALYKRGLPYVIIATTLLSQVDACLGGKGAVNLGGKNLIGTVYQPNFIDVSLEFLDTLPWKHRHGAMAEIIKYALIADQGLWAFLNQHSDSLWHDFPSSNLYSVVAQSLEIKKSIVEQDPFDQNKRLFLNFGHTFGHAIESVSDYQWHHGQAVGLGLKMALWLSAHEGTLSSSVFKTANTLIDSLCHLPQTNWMQPEEIWTQMNQDKKQLESGMRLILLKELGKPYIYESINQSQVMKAIRAVLKL